MYCCTLRAGAGAGADAVGSRCGRQATLASRACARLYVDAESDFLSDSHALLLCASPSLVLVLIIFAFIFVFFSVQSESTSDREPKLCVSHLNPYIFARVIFSISCAAHQWGILRALPCGAAARRRGGCAEFVRRSSRMWMLMKERMKLEKMERINSLSAAAASRGVLAGLPNGRSRRLRAHPAVSDHRDATHGHWHWHDARCAMHEHASRSLAAPRRAEPSRSAARNHRSICASLLSADNLLSF